MVVGASIGEQIVDDILVALREINGAPNYEHDVSESVHLNGSPLQLPSLPALVLFDEGQVDDAAPGNRIPNPLVTVLHGFRIVGVVTASQEGWQTSVRRLLVDAATKLRETYRRSELAFDTRVGGMQIDDSDQTGAAIPFGVGSLPVTVVYRHLFTDPTRAF